MTEEDAVSVPEINFNTIRLSSSMIYIYFEYRPSVRHLQYIIAFVDFRSLSQKEEEEEEDRF